MLKYCEKCGKTFQTAEKYCRICGEVLIIKEQPRNEKLDMQKIQEKFGTFPVSEPNETPPPPDIAVPEQTPPSQSLDDTTASELPLGDFTQGDIDSGIIKIITCTSEEQKAFSKMKKHGEPLPSNIVSQYNTDTYGNPIYGRAVRKVPKEKEVVFLLEKIYDILWFMKVCIIVGIVIAIILGLIYLIGVINAAK